MTAATSSAGGPTPLNAAVSNQMKRMPRTGTGPELAIRRSLHRRGMRFTVNRSDLPGSPDIVLSRARLAIFVDGCFWHRCPDHSTLPKNNREWWERKLVSNVERDDRKDSALRDQGWLPMHFWEHEDPSTVAAVLETLWRERTGRSAAPRGTGSLALSHPTVTFDVLDTEEASG